MSSPSQSEAPSLAPPASPKAVAVRRPKAAPRAVQSVTLKLADIDEDPNNARQVFDAAKLQHLADSIKAQGLLYPIVVRKVGDRFRVIDGHRRRRAAELAGLTEVRCEVQDLDDQAAALAAATANLQREDLTPYEQARAFRAALDLGMQKKELCERAGIVFNTLKARLQLLDLPEEIGRRIDIDGFTIGHAQAFLGLKDHPKLLETATKALDKHGADLPRAYDMPRFVAQTLATSGQVRQVGEGYSSWEHHGLDAKLAMLPHVDVKQDNGYAWKLVLDTKAYDDAVAAALEAKKEAEAKARAAQSKLDAAGKGEKAKQRHAAELDKLTDKEAHRLKLAGMVATLQKDAHVVDGVFEVIRQLYGNDGLLGLYDYGRGPDYAIAAWKAAGAAAAADPDAIGAWLGKEGEPGKGTPTWFTKLKPARQLAFVVALLGANELDGYGNDRVVAVLTGKSDKEWTSKGRKEAQRTIDAAKQAHEEGKSKGKGKAGAKDAAPAKAKAHQSTLGLSRAKAKLAKKGGK